ncbi:MAG: AbrB/MazE/SpoVT family DNA-binding domain-containing protein [Methylococcales bacterium]|nr:AbrB/MazE/SpoVT family DNA-binding domain-containing protein [Methylococcales bacterium]
MPKVSAKRQITIPIDQCKAMNIKPGDELEIFAADEQLILIKKAVGAAKGLLSHVQVKEHMTDEESRQSAIG